MKATLIAALATILLANSVASAKDKNEAIFERKSSAPFSFALIGDTPYGDAQVEPFDNVIENINSDKSVRFVMHAGDIKSGGARCDDERIQARFEQYQKFNRAFVYTPGDNEWTDCHRTSNGSFYPLERLDFLRSVFFPNPDFSTGKHPIRVLSQSRTPGFEPFVENVMFIKHKVLFSTLHVVGSNNDLNPWSGIDAADSFENPRPDRLQAYQARLEATLAWIDETFDRAEQLKARGVFLMMQANPRFELGAADRLRAGFNDVIDRIRTRTLNYGRPVIWAHGDFHNFLVDKPLDPDNYATADSELVANLTRIQTFGSPQVHWVKINVDPRSSAVFSIEQQIVKENVSQLPAN